jgi:hypothetical protein
MRLFHRHEYILKLYGGSPRLECIRCLKIRPIPERLSRTSGAFLPANRYDAEERFKDYKTRQKARQEKLKDELEIWYFRQHCKGSNSEASNKEDL